MNGIRETQVICSIVTYVLGFVLYIQQILFSVETAFWLSKLIMYEILDMTGKQVVFIWKYNRNWRQHECFFICMQESAPVQETEKESPTEAALVILLL